MVISRWRLIQEAHSISESSILWHSALSDNRLTTWSVTTYGYGSDSVMGDDECNRVCSNYRWKCYYYPINSYKADWQPCEQTVNHVARINLGNRHAIRLTYKSGIAPCHWQGAESWQLLVMHACMALKETIIQSYAISESRGNYGRGTLYFGVQIIIPFCRPSKRKNGCMVCRWITELYKGRLYKWGNNASTSRNQRKLVWRMIRQSYKTIIAFFFF